MITTSIILWKKALRPLSALATFILWFLPTMVWGGEVVSVDYLRDIKPVFESRCIQCHSCYNSPCQLKLTSPAGIRRGLIRDYDVYDTSRLRKYDITDIDMGAYTAEQWHDGEFHMTKNPFATLVDVIGFGIGPGNRTAKFTPIVPSEGEVVNPEDNAIIRLINERKSNPKGINDLLDYDNLQAENSRVCPDTDKRLNDHIKERAGIGSSAGMPYGLPPLKDDQINLLTQWIKEGAPMPAEGELLPDTRESIETDLSTIKNIEGFFNGESKKQKLVSRYIYEHLFLSHIYLSEENKSGQYYKLVRSATECTDRSKIEVLVTRRPWDKAIKKQAGDMWYCLRPIEDTITHKNHIIYLMDDAKILRYKQLFLASQWETQAKPSRANKYASNPFTTFSDIPVKARYQFLLDDAQHFIMSFIRGPVCKGGSATNSIDEQFYVMFLKPESDPMVSDSQFYVQAKGLLDLPANIGSEQFLLGRTYWFGKKIQKDRTKYRKMRMESYKAHKPKGYDFQDLWYGDSKNDGHTPNKNSNLTVFRNFDSATVVQGLVGPTSKTIFVVDYSILERLYYLLVSGYDVFADLNHHLHSRLYMSYLRSEAEEVFLNFLPANVRKPMRNSWNIPSDGATEGLYTNDVDLIHPMIGLDFENKNPYFSQVEGEISSQLRSENKSLDSILKRGENDILLLAEANRASTSENVVELIKSERVRLHGVEPIKYNKHFKTVKYPVYVDRDKLYELNWVLAKYRMAFSDKVKSILSSKGSRGYVDEINLDKNRYPKATSTQLRAIKISPKASVDISSFESELSQLMAHPAKNTPWVLKAPGNSVLLVEDGEKSYLYTFVRQTEHYNVNPIFGEDNRRNFNEDTVIAYKGILGSYPSYFFHIQLSQGQDFLQSIANLEAPESLTNKEIQRTSPLTNSYKQLVIKYGRPRTGPSSGKFWPTYDKIVKVFYEQDPIAAGYLDLNRYGIDYRFADSRSLLDK